MKAQGMPIQFLVPTQPNIPEYIDLTQPNLRQLYVRSLRDDSSYLIGIPGAFIEHLTFSLNTYSNNITIGYDSMSTYSELQPFNL